MHRFLAAFLVLLLACYRYQPPPPAEPRDATSVSASIDETWDAVIDLFATRNIPIRTIERASGIIATEGLSVDSADGLKWADCGQVGPRLIPANNAIYNVLVRGDSANSSVRATVRWGRLSSEEGDVECTSTYVWEHGLERDVQERAEAAHVAALSRAGHSSADPRTLPAQIESSPERPPAGGAQASPDARRTARNPTSASPRPARPIRSNDELLESASFRLAVQDAQRLNLLVGFREVRPDTLTLDLTDGALTAGSAEYSLARLYMAYRGTTDYSARNALRLMREGRRVGMYTPEGLLWETDR
jgi:hypothetical protein